MPANYNQSTSVWDFLANLEQQGAQHPLFPQNGPRDDEHGCERDDNWQGGPPFNSWGWGHQFFGGPGGMPHRGPPPHHHDEVAGEKRKEKEKGNDDNAEISDEHDNEKGPIGNSASDNEGQPRGHGRHGRCGGRRGRCGPGRFGSPRGFGYCYGPPNHGSGSHHGPAHSRRGRRGPYGCGGSFGDLGVPWVGPIDPNTFAAQLWDQFNDNHPSNKKENNESEDYSPDADIFDTEGAFVVHVSLPGAKKEDVGVNWDVEKSELSVAGVIYRPGDEDFLKTLAMNERKVGPFKRKIRLGTRGSPAHIDSDGITAKLEDGVLRIEVPKTDSGFVEIKKVDIE